jgi:hypothetical protein
MNSEVLMFLNIKITVFWDVKLSSSADSTNVSMEPIVFTFTAY